MEDNPEWIFEDVEDNETGRTRRDSIAEMLEDEEDKFDDSIDRTLVIETLKERTRKLRQRAAVSGGCRTGYLTVLWGLL